MTFGIRLNEENKIMKKHVTTLDALWKELVTGFKKLKN